MTEDAGTDSIPELTLGVLRGWYKVQIMFQNEIMNFFNTNYRRFLKNKGNPRILVP